MATVSERLRAYANALDPNEGVLDEAADLIDDLVKALGKAREVVDALAGQNQPSRQWAAEVRAKADAALMRARKG